MSVHSIDHIDDAVSDQAYKGYHIDPEGEVTEFYDHRDEEPAVSSYPGSSYRQPLVAGNGNGNSSSIVPASSQAMLKVAPKDAGCCNCCVSILTAIGTLPLGAGFAAFCCWLGTAMFIGGGWKSLDGSIELFEDYGPNVGNPATDNPPDYILVAGSFNNYELRDQRNLGNRVPEVFNGIKYSFYGIIPLMFFLVIALLCDNYYSMKNTKGSNQNDKVSGPGLCVTVSLLVCCFVVMLTFIFWLCFTTLGVYYYRITMLRCDDLNNRGLPDGVKSSICIDLVQLGAIMYQDTNDVAFGKICGPQTPPNPTFGDLTGYCDDYYSVYEMMLVTFSGCLLVVIGMVLFMIILSNNYNALLNKVSRRRTHALSRPPTSLPPHSAPGSHFSGPPVHIRGTRDPRYPDSDVNVRRSSKDIELDYIRGTREPRYPDSDVSVRRSSKDIELDYVLDSESSAAKPRYRELDSNVGVNYYYRDRPRH